MVLRGKAAGFGLTEALEGWCVCACVCSLDERETAGSWAVGLFLFHLRAGCQSLGTEDERKRAGVRREGRYKQNDTGKDAGMLREIRHEIFVTKAESAGRARRR